MGQRRRVLAAAGMALFLAGCYAFSTQEQREAVTRQTLQTWVGQPSARLRAQWNFKGGLTVGSADGEKTLQYLLGDTFPAYYTTEGGGMYACGSTGNGGVVMCNDPGTAVYHPPSSRIDCIVTFYVDERDDVITRYEMNYKPYTNSRECLGVVLRWGGTGGRKMFPGLGF